MELDIEAINVEVDESQPNGPKSVKASGAGRGKPVVPSLGAFNGGGKQGRTGMKTPSARGQESYQIHLDTL